MHITLELDPRKWSVFRSNIQPRPPAEAPQPLHPELLDAPKIIDARYMSDPQQVRDAIGAQYLAPKVMSVSPLAPEQPVATATPASTSPTSTQAPQPVSQEHHMSFLSHVGALLRKVLHIGEELAVVAEPLVAARFPDITPLYNSAIGLALSAESTAAKATGTGPQKLAIVVSQLLPVANEFLTKNNISMDEAAVNKWASAVVDTLNLIPAPQPAAAAPATV